VHSSGKKKRRSDAYTITNNNTTTSPQSSPVINSSAQIEPNNKDLQPLESKANKEQEAPIFDSDNNDKKIREEVENLREQIMEQVMSQ
jgi:hypothetical protein